MSEKVGVYIEPDGPCVAFVSDSSEHDSLVCLNCGWLDAEHASDDRDEMAEA